MEQIKKDLNRVLECLEYDLENTEDITAKEISVTCRAIKNVCAELKRLDKNAEPIGWDAILKEMKHSCNLLEDSDPFDDTQIDKLYINVCRLMGLSEEKRGI